MPPSDYGCPKDIGKFSYMIREESWELKVLLKADMDRCRHIWRNGGKGKEKEKNDG